MKKGGQGLDASSESSSRRADWLPSASEGEEPRGNARHAAVHWQPAKKTMRSPASLAEPTSRFQYSALAVVCDSKRTGLRPGIGQEKTRNFLLLGVAVNKCYSAIYFFVLYRTVYGEKCKFFAELHRC